MDNALNPRLRPEFLAPYFTIAAATATAPSPPPPLRIEQYCAIKCHCPGRCAFYPSIGHVTNVLEDMYTLYCEDRYGPWSEGNKPVTQGRSGLLKAISEMMQLQIRIFTPPPTRVNE
ncbi:unnamed protein product [Echinostoma caproni]|uniref:Uncharacterized protein n=1 Tax=Echinostoma caproni TaxID=27848 RepID=A0A183AYH2_9TREM|nr:unnamed protein product [Echinostoma caproni]